MRTFLFCSLAAICLSIACKKELAENNGGNNGNTPPIDTLTPKLPKVITNNLSNITYFSLVASGKLSDTGAAMVTEVGIVVDHGPGPTLERNLNRFRSKPDAQGNFRQEIVDVPAGSKYYFRAYAINKWGVAYGNEVSYTAGPEKRVSGAIYLTSQQMVDSFGALGYRRIAGSLNISGPVSSLGALQGLAAIENGLEIKGTQLKDLKGLDSLEAVGFMFRHGLRIENNPQLTSLEGLGGLRFNDGYFYLLNNPALPSLQGLQSFLFNINGEFRIEGCHGLRNMQGMEKFMGVYNHSLYIRNNNNLTDFTGWSGLKTVEDYIVIEGNPMLERLHGLEGITSCQQVTLQNNAVLANLNGLNNLEHVDYGIRIELCPSLQTIEAFSKIDTAGIFLSRNNSLASTPGFRNVVAGSLHIESNPALTDLSGFASLTTAERISILNNDKLQDLGGLEKLKTITNDAYAITVWNNAGLKSLKGLENLLDAKGSVQISLNRSLTDFCALAPFFRKAPANLFYYVEFNAQNPSRADIVANCR
ncbi:MAG: hypothetical protein MUF29_00415 [Chitinophagaceae bacterium]|nr:hypothetical protein [Chitinophagaceae bacterium]